MKIDDFPKCIQESELFKTLTTEFEEDDNSMVGIDRQFLDFPTSVKTYVDVKKWLDHYHYWMMKELPDEVYLFVLSESDKTEWKSDDFHEFPELEWVITKNISQETITEKQKETCFEKGFIKIIQHLELKKNNRNYCKQAALNGHLECLRYAHENNCPWGDWGEGICSCAAKNGHLECLRYAHENGCPWNKYTYRYAAKYGHLKCVKYMNAHGFPKTIWHSLSNFIINSLLRFFGFNNNSSKV